MWMTKKDGFDLEKKRKHKKFGCLFICALIFLFGCQERRKEPGVENSMRQNPVQESAEYDNSMQENPGVKVTFFDVEKGDAIINRNQGVYAADRMRDMIKPMASSGTILQNRR